MSGIGTRWRRAADRIRSIAVVIAIVAASAVGLHEWADDAATHAALSRPAVSQDAPAD